MRGTKYPLISLPHPLPPSPLRTSDWDDDEDDFGIGEFLGGEADAPPPVAHTVAPSEVDTARTTFWANPERLDPADQVREEEILGLLAVKEVVRTLIRLVKEWETYRAIPGIALPRGMLLFGKPGNGKTMTLRWLITALEGDCYYVRDFPVTGEEWVASDVRFLYEGAREKAHQTGRPVILLWDEMDAYVRKNRNIIGKDKVASEICAQMDGIRGQSDPIFLVGTANYTGGFEDAMVRAGRMSLVAECRPLSPSEARTLMHQRLALLEMPAPSEDELTDLLGDGDRSAIDIIEALSRIKTDAIMHGGPALTSETVARAMVRQFCGIGAERPEVERLRESAYHEVGHALIAHALGMRIQRMDVMRIGMGGGAVAISMNAIRTLADGFCYIVTGLGGRLMECWVHGAEHSLLASASEDHAAIVQQFVTMWLQAGGISGATFDYKSLANRLDYLADPRLIAIDRQAEEVLAAAVDVATMIHEALTATGTAIGTMIEPLITRLVDEVIILGSDASTVITEITDREFGWMRGAALRVFQTIPDHVTALNGSFRVPIQLNTLASL